MLCQYSWTGRIDGRMLAPSRGKEAAAHHKCRDCLCRKKGLTLLDYGTPWQPEQ